MAHHLRDRDAHLAPRGSSTTRLAAAALLLVVTPVSAQETPWRRDLARRRAALEEAGGSAQTERAVDEALRWLAAHQAEDGSWGPERWRERCQHGAPCQGGLWETGGPAYRPGVTALALLPFLARGIDGNDATFGVTVTRGVAWLIAQAGRNREWHGQEFYNEPLVALALSEHAALTGDARVLEAARARAQFCVEARNQTLGWKYGVRSGRNDTSVTAWMVHALRRAEEAGLEVPADEVFSGALAWFSQATDAEGRTGYETPGGGPSFLPPTEDKFDPLPAMTAAALFGRRTCGQQDPEVERRGAALLAQHLPEWRPRRLHFYYWFWGSHAARQLGGGLWTAWSGALQQALLPNQRRDGCAAGSWDPSDAWSLAAGRVYATAILALCLETYYRVGPLPARDMSAAGVAARAQEARDLEELGLTLSLATDGAAARAERHQALRRVDRALRDERPGVRREVAAAVARLDEARVATLVGDARDGPRHVRRDALRVLGHASRRDGLILDALVTALDDKEVPVRVAAAEALGRWGPDARPARPALQRLARDPEWAARNAAERALASIGG